MKKRLIDPALSATMQATFLIMGGAFIGGTVGYLVGNALAGSTGAVIGASVMASAGFCVGADRSVHVIEDVFDAHDRTRE